MDDLTKTIATTVSSAIEAQAKAQFLAALGGTDLLIDKFLHVASKYTVKRDYRDVPLLEATISDQVQELVKQLVTEMVQDSREELKVEVAKRLRSNSKELAERLVDAAIGEGRYWFVDVRRYKED